MKDLSSMLNDKGFTTLETDITVSGVSNSSELLEAYSKELRSTVTLSMTPFAPVFIARSTACLVTQKYISSYPASGIVLISPPTSNEDAEVGGKLPGPLQEFIYEPKFPIAILDTPDRLKELKEKNRMCREPGSFVDVVPVERLEGQPLFAAVDKWLDELGV
ncbi:hypothetical protein MD484_g1390, partial [Candolleomyces efflorescens]